MKGPKISEPAKMPSAGRPAARTFRHRILVADDDEALLTTTAEMLTRAGYEVITARDGFEALAALRSAEPNILISDLRMPNMSGFELLAVVRRRFPGVGVIVVSGEFAPLTLPDGVLADRFLQKSANSPFEILEAVRELVAASPLRPRPARAEVAPAWLPRSAAGYVVLTCPTCLRSFSIAARQVELGIVLNDNCIHCGGEISYRIDSTVATFASPSVVERSAKLSVASRRVVDESKALVENTQLEETSEKLRASSQRLMDASKAVVEKMHKRRSSKRDSPANVIIHRSG